MVHAQIILNYTDYHLSVPATDTLLRTTAGSAFPVFTQGPSQMWDLTLLTDSTTIIPRYYLPDTAGTFADSAEEQLLWYVFPVKRVYDLLPTGLVAKKLLEIDSAENTTAHTSGAYDSIGTYKSQRAFTPGISELPLPVNYGNSWSGNSVYDVPFNLSISFYGLNRVPGTKRVHLLLKDTVTGWGTMRVRDRYGLPGAYQEVLQVTESRVTTDSFFLRDTVMSNALSSSIGVIQGKADTQFVVKFYRVGELTPLASVFFKDAAYRFPTHALTHKQRLGRVAVPLLPQPQQPACYPNPLTGNELHLTNCTDGVYRWRLTNANGAKVSSGTVVISHHTGTLFLPKLLPGTYQLVVDQHNRVEMQQTVVCPAN
ncbi:MAG: T9SS C-terminal target domain-containing protein [Chitinophagia bacterium]|nr:T9SS C-terminal target domain-containing protein [Chitinophagia bacterium]